MGCCPSSQRQGAHRQSALENKAKVKSKEDVQFSRQNFVGLSKGRVRDNYIMGSYVGTGAYGQVRLATHRASKQQRAIKTILKSQLTKDMTERQKFFTEVDILRQLDHPNIVKLFEFYEDQKYFHIVTEALNGGELFDFIVSNRMLSESIAAHFMRQVLSAISYCHDRGIVHRDLKPENLLLDRKEADAQLKVIDFGTSTTFVPNKRLTHQYGTSYYIAPEVIKGSYDQKCDVWSCGVILYILLSGRPPFPGKNDKQILKAVEKGKYDYSFPAWQQVSQQAKDLIDKMLVYDHKHRISMHEALNDPWIQTYIAHETIPTNTVALQNLKNFYQAQKMQQAVMSFIVSQLTSKEEVNALTKTFQSMDQNGDGKLSRQELLQAYQDQFGDNVEEEVNKIMAQVDTDGSGFIDYSEFIAASMEREKLLSINNLESAFSAFDMDGSGSISAEELRIVLGNEIDAPDSVWYDIIKEVDQNGDGEIDINEFKEMMLRRISQ